MLPDAFPAMSRIKLGNLIAHDSPDLQGGRWTWLTLLGIRKGRAGRKMEATDDNDRGLPGLVN